MLVPRLEAVSAMASSIGSGRPTERTWRGDSPANTVTCALASLEAALHVQGSPVGLGLGLGDAVGVLAGMPDDAAVKDARNGGAGVHQDEADGPADGGVGAVARPEQVVAGVDVQLAGYRPVYDGQDARASHAG